MFKKLIRWFSRTPTLSIEGARRAVEETINIPAKLRLTTAYVRKVAVEISRNGKKLAELAAHRLGLEGHPGLAPGAEIESRGNLALATTFAVVDFPLQLLLARVQFPHWTLLEQSILALAVAVGFGSLGFGLLRSINNYVRPEQSIRAGKMMSLGMTVAVIISFGVVMYLRFATEDTSDEFFSSAAISLWFLAEALPFTAGLWAGVAYLRAYPRMVDAEIRDLDERQAALHQFSGWLNEQLRRLPPAGGLSSTTAVMFLIAMLFMCTGQASAQVCAAAADRTASGDSAQRHQAIAASMAHLGEFLEIRNCQALVAASFADAGPFTPRQYFEVPQAPRAADCESVPAAKVDPQRAALLAFGGYQKRLQKTARTSCLEDQARARAAFAGRRATFLKQVRTVITREQISTSKRTDIRGLLVSFFEAGIRDVLLITDGVDQQGVGRVPSSARLFIVQYAVDDDFGNGVATDSAAVQWRRAGATVLPYPILMPGIWKRWKS